MGNGNKNRKQSLEHIAKRIANHSLWNRRGFTEEHITALKARMDGNKINLGRIQSIEGRENRRLSMLGKNSNPKSQETKDKIRRTLTGRKDSPEIRLKKSHQAWNKGLKGFRAGDMSNLWKGGITPENIKTRASIEYSVWRKSCFERDNYTCQKTEIKGGELRAHHINNFAEFPELRFAIDNGTTLSNKAHKEFHKKYGFKNNTREQLDEFLSFKVLQIA